jgi:hypothetical protein
VLGYTPARAGDMEAVGKLARLLAEHGDLDEAARILQARGDTWLLAKLLAEGGAVEELRTQADAGDRNAA